MTQFPFTSQLRAKTILIPTFKSITLVDPDEITYVKAMQNYCMLYKQDGSRILSSSSFGSIIEQLDFHGFYHCHKSYAINMSKVMRYLNTGQVVQVTYIRAMQNYCKLHQLDGSQVLVSISFGKVLNLFSDFAFHQCHRSYAVNGRHFIKLHKSLKIEMDCGGMVPVARRRKRAFLEGLG